MIATWSMLTEACGSRSHEKVVCSRQKHVFNFSRSTTHAEGQDRTSNPPSQAKHSALILNDRTHDTVACRHGTSDVGDTQRDHSRLFVPHAGPGGSRLRTTTQRNTLKRHITTPEAVQSLQRSLVLNMCQSFGLLRRCIPFRVFSDLVAFFPSSHA